MEVAEATTAEREAAVAALAAHIQADYGAPDAAAAEAAAREEIGFAESLCDHPPGTVLALSRAIEAGAVRESFRTLHRRAAPHRDFGTLSVFGIVEVAGEDAPVDHPDLTALAKGPATITPGDFWLSSGHQLCDRDEAGRLVPTPDLWRAFLARPEFGPPPEACEAERALHAGLLAAPLRPVPAAGIAALADADARENWQVFLAFRDRVQAEPTLEAAWLALFRGGVAGIPPLFLQMLTHLVTRAAMEGVGDAFTLRAAEAFFAPSAPPSIPGRCCWRMRTSSMRGPARPISAPSAGC